MSSIDEEGVHFGIRQISELLGVPQSTLRYYESENLITTTRKEQSNYRDYSYVTMIELTDIILYRKLGIPVKQMPELMNATAEESLEMIETSIDQTEEKVEELLKCLQTLKRKRRKITTLENMRHFNARIVDHTSLTLVTEFPIFDEKQMKYYLEHPQNSVVYFPDAADSEVFIDGIQVTPQDHPKKEDILWQEDETGQMRYWECLMRADYALTQNNNLRELLEEMKTKGLTPGYAIGGYLMAEYDKEEKKKYDYYQMWIEIKEN